jgi:hypothetical protein
MRALLGVLAVVASLVAVTGLTARADPDDPIDRIPSPAPSASALPAATHRHSAKVFLEEAGSFGALRGNLQVPFPRPGPASGENRTSLDAIQHWGVSNYDVTLSGRLNLTESSTFGFPSNQTLRGDLREAFVSVKSGSAGFFEVGRINVHNGVALGVNPSDFLKGRTLVEQSSLDPSVIRNDRLGVVGVSYERLSDRGAVRIFYAPRLAAASQLSFIPSSGLNLRFDDTNSENRMELSLSRKVADLEPQLIAYVDGSQLRYGLNISHQASKSVVLYGEFAGGSQADLVARALRYGERTGTFPPSVTSALSNSPAIRFKGDATVGASWTSQKELTVTLEYDYHQAGLSHRDWQNWIDLGAAAQTSAGVRNELWYVRSYANTMQEPLVQQQAFVRVDQPDAFISHLELTGFAFINLYDASLLAQLSAKYDFSDRWSAALFVNGNVGNSTSERGSLPQSHGITAQISRYF